MVGWSVRKELVICSSGAYNECHTDINRRLVDI